jgi:hypothetical protein
VRYFAASCARNRVAVYGVAPGKKIREKSIPMDMYPPGLAETSINTFFFPAAVAFCKKSVAICATSDALDENVGKKMTAVSCRPVRFE